VAALALQRSFAGFGRLLYIPKGPGVVTVEDLAELGAQLRAGVPSAFVVRVESEIEETDNSAEHLAAAGLVKSPADIQINRATVVVDLRPAAEDLLASFKAKTRYNIRLAERKEVVVQAVEASQTNLDLLYDMMAATRDRAGFYLRPRQYYQGYWRLLAERGQGQLFLASFAGQPLAAAFATFLGKKSWFKDGGSFRTEQQRMPSYLLQWEMMLLLKARGVESYDLVGVPPRDRMTPDHSLFSLVQFKTGFSDAITQYIGTWDIPLQPATYRRWIRFGERLHAGIHRRLHHDLLW
jgi:lipid II:glycine glycyltransferase (peptidoglycan interpeptide bridge formation enzyme)